MQRHDDMNVGLIVFWGLFAGVLTFALVLGVQALYYRAESQQHNEKVVASVYVDAESALADQDAKLTRYGWLQRDEGRVAIPIERAMELIVRQQRGQQQADTSKPTDNALATTPGAEEINP